MKLTKTEPKLGFSPYEIIIAVETEEDQRVLHAMTQLDVSIPEAVRAETKAWKKPVTWDATYNMLRQLRPLVTQEDVV